MLMTTKKSAGSEEKSKMAVIKTPPRKNITGTMIEGKKEGRMNEEIKSRTVKIRKRPH